jgi:UDP-glucose 4-epimerase
MAHGLGYVILFCIVVLSLVIGRCWYICKKQEEFIDYFSTCNLDAFFSPDFSTNLQSRRHWIRQQTVAEKAYESELLQRTDLNDTDLEGTSFRFFNVVGSLSPELKDGSLDNLVPKLLKVIESNNQPTVFGSDYPTKDGSCVRDYVDIRDIANAHVLAINSPNELPRIMNLGSGVGASVIDVIKSLEKITDRKLEPIFESRRKGDPASLCANMELTKRTLGFNPKFTLEESLLSILD